MSSCDLIAGSIMDAQPLILHMNAPDNSDRNSVLLLGLALLAGCVLRCWNITQSFWWDEIWSTLPYAKAHSVWHIFTDLGYYFNNHLLNSLLVRYSIQLFGESELAARLPALILGLLAVPAVFQFGKRFLGGSGAGMAALLLACSPFHIDHSSEARGYSGLALFSVLSSFYFLKGVQEDKARWWIVYTCFTVLGFCSHVFMVAVSLSQFFTALLLAGMITWFPPQVHISSRALRNAVVSLLCAGVITLLIYSPLLPAFLENLGKVRLVSVNRIPFVASLVTSFLFPGITSLAGCIIYGVLLCLGMYAVLRKDALLFVYLLVLFVLPLSLYLLINPMFVFERYFIFLLPFALLVLGRGIMALAGRLRPPFRSSLVIALVAMLVYLQYPAITRMLNQDRQNYREAVRYVEEEMDSRAGDLVCSLGYAGEHFGYYTRKVSVYNPESMDELSALMKGKERIWCLITAWLPDLRPSCEDEALYAERPGQVELYNYVKTHFVLKKHFSSKYGVDIYYKEQ